MALVTGGSRGIGKQIALKFASEGADVAFTYQSNEAVALETMSEIEAIGRKTIAFASNASSFDDTHVLVNNVIDSFGHIDILVNNAGITKDGLILRMTQEQWDSVIDVNLKSAFNFIHSVAPSMARQRSGSIINISSVVGVHGNAGQTNYAASKAGMIGLAKSVAAELGSRGVRANVVAPGFICTEMTEKLPEDIKKSYETRIPLRRGGKPEEVADLCVFLASDRSSYITGQVIQIDGGMGM